MSAKTLFIFAIAVIAIAGTVISFWKFDKERTGGNDSAGLVVANNAIYVSEQAPGERVSISMVRLEKPGFVVIHEDDGGAPGKILGTSQLLSAGENQDIAQILLSRPTQDGETLYAMLHIDDGNGIFDAAKDKPAVDPVGKEPVMTIVDISKDAAEPGIINL